jgi:coenzyme F420 hydrogenase subunit beta
VKSIDKLKRVMDSHLCSRCGSCVGLSGGSIIFADRTGSYRPKIIHPVDDQLADVLWQSCAGKEFDFPGFTKKIFGQGSDFHRYLGAYKNIYIGHTTDQKVRLNSASGGIISAVSIYLLETGKVDGVICLRMSKDQPWLSEPFIATTKEDILDAAQSKYTISSVNEILAETAGFAGNLAYVGLPGQVQSIRKLQQINHPSVQNIKYILGPFYGNTLHFSSVKSFLKSYGVKDHTQIKRLYFRHGEWPGNMRVELNDGKVIELKKFHANYLIPFHILKNSLLCSDLSNEFTDISGGDAWAPVYEERGKGFSMVISRSERGQHILDEMAGAKLLHLDPVETENAIAMHSHGYDLKKRGTFIRIRFRKWLGKPVPDYGYEISGFPFKRFLFEFLLDMLFLTLSTRPARWLVEQVPPERIGRLFETARTKWKKATSSVKRDELTE